MNYYIYNTFSGQITKRYNGPSPALQLGANEAYMPSHDLYFDSAHYIVDGIMVARPENTTLLDKTTIDADGIDMATFINIPSNSDLQILSPEDETVALSIQDGVFSFTCDLAGVYKFTFNSFPELQKEFEINAA